ncbi:MAG: sigma-54-dependent Fis family transcriptional regulator [Candidatus Stahlbacteria bacterium]|nr:sigma-54-dependent Fis family transcriptional regulator [Candidatus Stahlbacteria bacterium]
MKDKILIIDDEVNILSVLSDILKDDGYFVFTATTGEKGLGILKNEEIDLTLLDVKLPDMNGITILERIKITNPRVEVIMISGHTTIELAVKATKLGAYDFIEKPLSIERVRIAILRALERSKLLTEKDELAKIGMSGYKILGESSAMKSIRETISRCAPTDSKVLILGETGTGKELVAGAIHYYSLRSRAPFIKVNCAAIPETLIESELFGHEKGAFTGATSKKVGKFELANNGTIFLDEIGDMGLSCQAKVLRILETGELERVGGTQSIKVDVRVIAATNKDMANEIKENKFRDDLYYRLNVVPIYVPSLKEHRSDIPIFIRHFMTQFCQERSLHIPMLDTDALALLSGYDYPGNIRELRNIVERIAIMIPKEIITAADVSPLLGLKPADRTDILSDSLTLSQAQKVFLKKHIERELMRHNYNIKATAETLGIERPNLYRKMKELGIQIEREQ